MPKGEVRLRTGDGLLNQIGQRVKKRRAEVSMTQDRLCARLTDVTGAAWNVHRHEVVAIENGSRAVTTVELVALASALETTACLLLVDGAEETETK